MLSVQNELYSFVFCEWRFYHKNTVCVQVRRTSPAWLTAPCLAAWAPREPAGSASCSTSPRRTMWGSMWCADPSLRKVSRTQTQVFLNPETDIQSVIMLQVRLGWGFFGKTLTRSYWLKGGEFPEKLGTPVDPFWLVSSFKGGTVWCHREVEPQTG